MSSAGFDLRVGGRVWLDGQGWEVAELTGDSARLLREGCLRTVSIASLATSDDAGGPAETVDGPADDLWSIPSVVLAGLSTRQRDALAKKLATLRTLLEPGVDDQRSLGQRYEHTAEELGTTRRTLERQVARLVKLGPAGLVDTRLLQQVRRTVDPRWDSICLQVLASFTNASNPTKQAVIDRANREFEQAVPDGKPPSLAVAYRRLDELDHGRYTFGAAKQRRSVAKRPTGVLGRLRADRPGQYGPRPKSCWCDSCGNDSPAATSLTHPDPCDWMRTPPLMRHSVTAWPCETPTSSTSPTGGFNEAYRRPSRPFGDHPPLSSPSGPTSLLTKTLEVI